MTVITAKQASQALDVSEATIRNWVKHGFLTPMPDTKSKFRDVEVDSLRQRIISGEVARLKSRANKRNSSNSYVPDEYIKDSGFVAELDSIKNTLLDERTDVEVSLFVLVLKLLAISGEVSRHDENVLDLENYFGWKRDCVKAEIYAWSEELTFEKVCADQAYQKIYDSLTDVSHADTIGIVYQSLLHEGDKSKLGAYYTPEEIVDSIFNQHGARGGRFLDPCCGSGQFLLGAARSGLYRPEQLYGYDIDRVAIRIATINLLLAFPADEFTPQVFHANTLADVANGSLFCETNHLRGFFNLVSTNPPWGSLTKNEDANYRSLYPHIKSGESFSLFLSKCIDLLETGGHLSFVLPESILNIKVHADIRFHILNNMTVDAIYSLGRKFKGVFTPVIRLELTKRKAPENSEILIYHGNNKSYTIPQRRFMNNQDFVFDVCMSGDDFEILKKVFSKPHQFLAGHAEWALGIVTGDNKKYVSNTNAEGLEPVYTGSDIEKFNLKNPSAFIEFTPKFFQQVAPERMYRTKEKLIYKFISNKLVFAYDKKGSLTLNSANIMIPKLENYPMKLVLAFLNSSLYQFIFSKKFNTLKVLRSDLEKLPFPMLTEKQSARILSIVDSGLDGADIQDHLDREVMQVFDLSSQQIEMINQQQ